MLAQILVQTLFLGLASLVTLIYMGKGRLVQRKVFEVIHGKAGCLPVPDVGNVTLHYFAASGRAEVIRLLMEETGITYKETGYTKQTWPAMKKQGIDDGKFMFGQVPVIVTSSGETLPQAQAITHYLGRATGLDCNCEDYSYCEVLALGVADVRQKLGTLLHDKTHTMADRANYLNEVLPIWLGYLERIAPQLTNQKEAFFVGDRLTWVDILIFDVLDYNTRYGKFDYGDESLGVDVLSKLPRLKNFYRLISNRPNMVKYLSNDARYPFVPLNTPRDAPKSS